MRVTYVTQTRFPTEKAHGHQIAHVCSAMAKLSHTVTLVSPTIGKPITKDPHAYYHVPATFDVKKLKQFDALSSPFVPGFLAFALTMASYRSKLSKFLSVHAADVVYTRSPAVLAPLLQSGVPVIIELHTLPRYRRAKFAKQCNQCKRVVCLTSLLKDELLKWGVESKRLLVEGDAVDLSRFKDLPTVKKSKHHWDLPENRFVIGYIGSLVTFRSLTKGVDDIIDAVTSLRRRKIEVFGWIVGGPEVWRHKYRKLASIKAMTIHDIEFHEAITSRKVADAMSACDVLVYPAPQSTHPYFQRDTSPLKLFEYLASGRPIICADIPPVRDIVSKDSVYFYHPGSSRSLAGAVLEVMENRKDAEKRANVGLKFVQEHSWEKRMQRILK